jgi:hypothetical protein
MKIGYSQIYENWHDENYLNVFHTNINTLTKCISFF